MLSVTLCDTCFHPFPVFSVTDISESLFFSVILPSFISLTSVQFSSVAQSCPIICNPMNLSMPGVPFHHQLLEYTQTHVHWVGDAIQPSHPLSSPSPSALNLSQHQGLFQWVPSLHQVAKVLEVQLQQPLSSVILPFKLSELRAFVYCFPLIAFEFSKLDR